MAWQGLIAELTDALPPGQHTRMDQRRRKRLDLRFAASLADADGPSGAVVLDLSEAGFMMNTRRPLAVGDSFTVNLPEAGPVEAQVVWKRVTLHGCEFAEPVTRRAISATLLRAAPLRGPESAG